MGTVNQECELANLTLAGCIYLQEYGPVCDIINETSLISLH